MSFQTARDTIMSNFNTLVTVAEPLPTQFDNQNEVDRPETGLFARVTIDWGDDLQVDVGTTNRYRTIGIFTVRLFSKLGLGDKDLLVMIDKIIALFRGTTYAGVKFRTPNLFKVGRVEEDWQININCPFYTDNFA